MFRWNKRSQFAYGDSGDWNYVGLRHFYQATQQFNELLTTAPQRHSQKTKAWAQLILCTIHHNTVLLPDVTTIAAQ